ncbi:unnamed protein product [Chondrus crispus]|uniref:Uncharacterized protein n=1 Tax=Chondrus crispus TaxID=2769 RepID=R7Q580_CHOCR|nr:unnamed protein product [Chondrus crispus]CDF33712.1 unnamed protein product [Chondrus crispus]|eukprot:XP_005713531.1 unnamed protein product [Chondrus crispus]
MFTPSVEVQRVRPPAHRPSESGGSAGDGACNKGCDTRYIDTLDVAKPRHAAAD